MKLILCASSILIRSKLFPNQFHDIWFWNLNFVSDKVTMEMESIFDLYHFGLEFINNENVVNFGFYQQWMKKK